MIAASLMCATRVPTSTWIPCGYMLVKELGPFGIGPEITLPTTVARLLIQNSAPTNTAVLLI
jgi:hypothetical protein